MSSEDRTINGSNGQVPSDEFRRRLFHFMFFGTNLDKEASIPDDKLTDDRLKAIMGVINKQIPDNPSDIKETALFRVASRAIKFQRDNYLVGNEYAQWNAKNSNGSHEIPYDTTALSHAQIANVLSNFIPTPTVQKALTPIVASLPSNGLYDPVRNATVSIIEGQRGNLETLLKNRLLQFLDNPRNRDAIKASTQGLLINQTTTKTNNNDKGTQSKPDKQRGS